MNKAVSALRARLRAILIWVVIIAAIFGLVTVNRNKQARLEAALASADANTRDATVQELIGQDRLIDVLTNTQNPNEDKDSAQNKKSVTIRQNAADSVNRLATAKKIDAKAAMNTLFLLRKDPDQGVKDRATDGLTALGKESDANLRAIVSRLKDGDPDIRGAAVDALAKIGGANTAQAVDPMVKDPAAQDAAQSALVKLAPEGTETRWATAGTPSVPFIIAHLKEPETASDLTRQQQLVDMLRQIASPTAVPTLMETARTSPPSVRRIALVALANTVLSTYAAKRGFDLATADFPAQQKKDPKAKPPAPGPTAEDIAQVTQAEPVLIAALQNSNDDSEARSQAALTLGKTASPQAIAALGGALDDFDTRVRRAALQGITSVGPAAVPSLIAALKTGDALTRPAAAQALGGIGSPPAVAALNVAFANPATPIDVRESAAIGLGSSGNPAVVPSLVAALGDPNGRVASAASVALQSSELTAAAVPPLVAAFTRPAPVPFNASQTLAQLGARALPALQAAAASPNPQTQTWAAVTLGQMESRAPSVIAALTPLKNSANPSVQWAATQALDRLSGS